MARLEAAWAARKEALEDEKGRKLFGKSRLVADPLVSVDQIQDVLEGFMKHKQTTDLWRIISAPPSMAVVSWQTPASPEWLSKVSGLLFDVVAIAKNTKLQSTKVQKALKQLHANQQMSIPRSLGSPENAFDKMDLSLRIVLSMLRQVKVNEQTKSRVLRCLSREEQLKLEMVLDKVILPKECFAEQGLALMDDSQEQEQVLDLQPLCLVPASSPQDERVSLQKGQSKEDMPCAKPCATERPKLKRSQRMNSSSFVDLSPPPKIFQKILHGKQGPGEQQKAEQGPGVKGGQQQGSDDLLLAAQSFVPAQLGKAPKVKKVSPKVKKPPNKNKNAKVQPTGHSKAIPVQTAPKAIAKAKASKKKQTASQQEPRPDLPAYVVDVEPKDTDTYRGLYTSRHYHKANQQALKWGLSAEDAKARGRQAGAQAGAKWDAFHGKTSPNA